MVEEDRAVVGAAASQAWLHRTLEEIVSQVRALLEVSGASFLVVDWERSHISPAASWFASEEVRDVFGRVLDRPYDTERPGITEAAIESGAPIRIERIEDWPGGDRLRRRLFDTLEPEAARAIWDWYRSSSFLCCPVRTSDGQVLGVLALARSHPEPVFSAADLRATVVLADLAALALERSELLDREERRSRDEEALNRASQEVTSTLVIGDVERAVTAHAVGLSGASAVRMLRQEPGGRMREVARAGDGSDVEGHATAPEIAVPLALGPRVLGTLVATAADPDRGVERLRAFAPVAAAAVANALEYERERRVARALTAGFIPELPREVAGLEVGVLYEPAGKQASGGDVFGIWPLPGGALGLMVGDVSGSGLEVAATAAMVRFFAEARTFDTRAPAKVLEQTNAILRGRLPEGLFVPTFLAVIEGRTLRWSNAGHPAPELLRADGEGVAALGTTGIPLGVDEESRYEELEVELAPGDVLVAATDGLWEARRDGVQFGDARLTGLLAEVGRLLDPDALVRRLRDEAEHWAGELRDDLVILAVRVCD